MQFQLIGWSHYGFTNDSGKYVEGYKFHICRQSAVRDFHGMEVAALSVSEDLVHRMGLPELNGLYNVTYDQKGRLAGYSLVEVLGKKTTQSSPRSQ